MRVVTDRNRVRRAIAAALDRGATKPVKFRKGTTNAHTWATSYAANCSSPITVEQIGRRLTKGAKSVHAVVMTGDGYVVNEIEVPCRLCENCLRRRAAHWRLRALSETKAAVRTWFSTLTLTPDAHAQVAMALRLEAARNGDDFDALSPEKQFACRHFVICRELTLYLKRIRKDANSTDMRFLCVAEAHKTGLPHYHMLIHEGRSAPIKWATLSKKWRIGFSNHVLVTDPKQAGYVCKYLQKSSMARVRASLDYGKSDLSHSSSMEREPSDPTQHSGCPTPVTVETAQQKETREDEAV